MAHFRRRRPRARTWDAIRGSQASWRARFGFKPPRIPRDAWKLDRIAWEALWRPYPTYNEGRKLTTGYYSQMNQVPAWWVRSFLVRPYRAKQKARLHAVRIGRLDPDDVCWPPIKKSQGYYW